MELYIISKWFDKYPDKKNYLIKHIDKNIFPIVDFEKKGGNQ